ncbi:hypothetical protein amrb99_04300 [Actinomadura sp. RB99]|uniref:hypothetical protein n=1 Tax=Actinomadura sp. RB99 TaxID=2691577 RepID=UPI0016899BCA|nr:hypothetical protein [Actinomadura sp. RB99]MBD2891524.1 hypothetical protein [Actinomadura sp. RB99]
MKHPPPPPALSDPTGREVVQAALAEAAARLDERLVAAFAIGSLAHGGFAPLVSDVDVALVVDRADAAAATAVDTVRRDTIQRYAGTPHHALASRLSLFWSDWESLADGTDAGRFPATDRLDLLDSGVLLYGADRRSGCARPGRDELLLDSAAFAATRFADPAYVHTLRHPEGLAAEGARAATKAVLFPVRFLYTAATGMLGRNDDAARWYTAPPQPSSSLVAAAGRWRAGGIDDATAAAELLRRELLPLYLHCLDRLREHTAAAGRPDLAVALARLLTTLA